MTRWTAAVAAAAVGAAAVAFAAAYGAVGLVDAMAGILLLLLAVPLRRQSPRSALLAAAAGALWFLGGVLPAAAWVHRPVLVWLALAFPGGRPGSRAGVIALAATVPIAVPPLSTDPRAMAVSGTIVAAAGVAELWRSRSWPSITRRTRGRSALWLGLAFCSPVLALGLGAAVEPIDPAVVETVYAGSVAACALTLLGAALGRDHLEAEAVLALTETHDADHVLGELQTRAPSIEDAASRRAMQSAIALLERNVAAQRDLAAAVEQARRSRLRLLDTTVLVRRSLRRRLAQRAQPLLPEIQSILETIRCADASAQELLVLCRHELRHLDEDLDLIADGLHPARLTQQGLAAVADMFTGSPIQVSVHLPTRRLPADVEAAVWYACAEAVTNAVKHGRAHRVAIDGREAAGELTVEVHDDGAGGAQLRPGGGLAGLADRLAALGGAITLASRPGMGTTVRMRIPLP